MKAKLQHILIDVKMLKTGYIVLVDHPDKGKPSFGTISKLNKDGTARVDCIHPIVEKINDKNVIVDIETSQIKVDKVQLLNRVVKLLAILKDYRSFSIIHGDFDQIIRKIPDVERFIKDTQKVSIEGNIIPVPTYPKVDDVVKLISLDKAERHNMLRNKTDRIGVVLESNHNVFKIEFPNGIVLDLKRATFEILSNTNTKYVFELDKS